MKNILLYIIIILIIVLGFYIKVYNIDSNDEIKKRNIKVYITGEIMKEGVYTLKEDERIIDLIKLAGGLKKNADKSKINLAKNLIDGEKIIIAKILKEGEKPKTKINNNLLNIDFSLIDGISIALNKKIKEYIKNKKDFKVDDLINVNGIGPKKLESIKKYLSK